MKKIKRKGKKPLSEFNVTVDGKGRKKGLVKAFCLYIATDFNS